MKVTAFVGSARNKSTYQAALQFIENLKKSGNIDSEIVKLSDYNLEICRGCKNCFEKGEEFCPFKDDRDILIDKMKSSDGVVVATPNYSFDMSGLTKVFLDRLGYVFHRPEFFGKTFTGIVVQGIYRGEKIAQYFNFIGKGLGFKVVKSTCLTILDPMTEKEQKKIERTLAMQSRQFHSSLVGNVNPVPGLFDLMIFRMSRSSMHVMLEESTKDFAFYRKMGWFESDYYYPVHLNMLKKGAGKLMDRYFTSYYSKKMEKLRS